MILTYSVYPVIIDCAVAISIRKGWAIISRMFKDLFHPCPNTDMRERQHWLYGGPKLLRCKHFYHTC